MGKTPYEQRFGEPFKGPIIPFGSMIEYHPISAKGLSRLHQFGRKFYLECSLDTHCMREKFGKETFWSQTTRSWKIWTRRKSLLNAKEVITPKNGQNFTFPIADGTVKLSGRDHGIRKIHFNAGPTCKKWRAQCRPSREFGQVSKSRMTKKPAMTSGQAKGITLIVIMSNLEFSSMCREKKHSQFLWDTLTWSGEHIRPWMCCTPCRRLLERWCESKFIGIRDQIHAVHNIEWETSWRIFVVRGGLQNVKQLSVLISTKGIAAMGYRETEARHCKKVERHLLIDPDDKEFKETIKKTWKWWKFQWKPQCFVVWRRRRVRTSIGDTDNESNKIPKSKHACIVEAHESTRKRLERALPKDCEDRIAGKGFNSFIHYNLVHKFVPVPQAMKIPDAEGEVGKEWEKLDKLPAWQMATVMSRRQVIQFAQNEQVQHSILLRWWISVFSTAMQQAGSQIFRCKSQHSVAYAVFTEQGSSASHTSPYPPLLDICLSCARHCVNAHAFAQDELSIRFWMFSNDHLFGRTCFRATCLESLIIPRLFPTTLVTESERTCVDLRSGSLYGRTADQSPIASNEPKDLNELFTEWMPINFSSRRRASSPTTMTFLPLLSLASEKLVKLDSSKM